MIADRARIPAGRLQRTRGSSDVSVGECVVVNPVTPTLTTDAGDGGTIGTAVSDQVTLGARLRSRRPRCLWR